MILSFQPDVVSMYLSWDLINDLSVISYQAQRQVKLFQWQLKTKTSQSKYTWYAQITCHYAKQDGKKIDNSAISVHLHRNSENVVY